ncbi:hypothetical protein [Pseudomonas cichorii]|uniref:hypothetical protein n=1 Tax=Pseudomonas cichorii TaxID=36746 RepID=UPI00217FD76B|nr:hypothetical protein [Pseudomonas cichorii]
MLKPQLTIQLSDAQRIPQVGLGVWQASNDGYGVNDVDHVVGGDGSFQIPG